VEQVNQNVAADDMDQPATQDTLNEWFLAQEELAKIKDREMALRKRIARTYFPNPVEGTNTAPLSEGWVMKLTHKIDRKLDIPVLTNLADEFLKAELPLGMLVKNKPELDLKAYRALPDEKRAMFERAMTIKPGSPSLEIVKPKRA